MKPRACIGRTWLVALASALVFPAGAQAASLDEDALKQLDDARLTLVRALDAAEAASKGLAIGVHVKVDGQSSEVIAHCVVKDKCMLVPVDVKTGKAGKLTECTARDEASGHSGKVKDIAKMFGENQMSLIAAIGLAEKEGKGKAVWAKSVLEAGKLDVQVRVGAAGKWQTITVDTKTKVAKGGASAAEKKDKEKKEEKEKDKGGKGKKP